MNTRTKVNSASLASYNNDRSTSVEIQQTLSNQKLYLLDLLNPSPTSSSSFPETEIHYSPLPQVKSKSTIFSSIKSSIRTNSKRKARPISFIMESNSLPIIFQSGLEPGLELKGKEKNLLVPRKEIRIGDDSGRREGMKDFMAFLRGEEEDTMIISSSNSVKTNSSTTSSSKSSQKSFKGSPKSIHRKPVPLDYLPLRSDSLLNSKSFVSSEELVSTPSSLAFLLDSGEYDDNADEDEEKDDRYFNSFSNNNNNVGNKKSNLKGKEILSRPRVQITPLTSTSFSNSNSLEQLLSKNLPPTPPSHFSNIFTSSSRPLIISILSDSTISTSSSSNESFHSISPTTTSTSISSRREISSLFEELHSLLEISSHNECLNNLITREYEGDTRNYCKEGNGEVELEKGIEILIELNNDLSELIDGFIENLSYEKR